MGLIRKHSIYVNMSMRNGVRNKVPELGSVGVRCETVCIYITSESGNDIEGRERDVKTSFDLQNHILFFYKKK